MKTQNSLFGIIISVLLSVIFISGCGKDNPMINNEPPFSFDSARFDVIQKIYNFPAFMAYVKDTNNIFLGDINIFYVYQNGSFNMIPLGNDFVGTDINGIDENNVYICGKEILPNNKSVYSMRKWNGSSIVTIPITDTLPAKHSSFSYIFCKSANEIWVGSNDGSVWKYDGTEFIKYILDTNNIIDTNYHSNYSVINYSYLLSDNINIYAVYCRDSFNIIGTEGKGVMKFYQYDNFSKFTLLSKHNYIYPQDKRKPNRVYNIGNKFYSVSEDGFYSFDFFGFNKMIDIGPISPHSLKISGTDAYNIAISGQNYDYPHLISYLFHWNGIKWSIENKVIGNLGTIYLKYLNDMYIRITTDIPGPTYITYYKKNNNN